MANDFKPNDWIVSLANNSDFAIGDFQTLGLTPDNTQLLSKDAYKDTKYIQDNYKTADGQFDDKTFDALYDVAQKSYTLLAQQDNEKNWGKNISVNYGDITAPPGTKMKDISFELKKVPNPTADIVGITGINKGALSGFSFAEKAQANSLRDKDGNILGQTANDLGALGTIFNSKTYAIATYDEDGFHDNSDGRKVKHIKGEYKLDDMGKGYYQELGSNDDISGKRILNWTDVLTTDGSAANRWDMLDTDGLDASLGRILFKNALKIAPLLIPGENIVSGLYAGATAGMALAQSLPGIVKAIDGVINNYNDPAKKDSVWKGFNSLQGFADRFKSSSTEYSQGHMFSSENLVNMLSDIGMLLQQQQVISNLPQMLSLNNAMSKDAKLVETEQKAFALFKDAEGTHDITQIQKAGNALSDVQKTISTQRTLNMISDVNLSQNLSSAFMAITSAGDTFEGMKNDGHDDRTAGLMTLGTLAGFYGMFKYLPIGNWMQKGLHLDDASKLISKSIQESTSTFSKELNEKLALGLVDTTELSDKTIFNKGKNAVSSIMKLIDDAPEKFTGAMLAQGIEGVVQQSIPDAIKIVGNLANSLGYTKGKTNFDASDITTRYAFNFLGGAMGAGLHVGIEGVHALKRVMNDEASPVERRELQYATYKYGVDAVHDSIERLYKKGNLPVDKTLGLSTGVKVTDAEGNETTTYSIAKDETDTAAYVIKETLKGLVTDYGVALRGLTENSFDNDIDRSILGDKRLSELLKVSDQSKVKDDLMKIVGKYIDSSITQNSLDPSLEKTSEEVLKHAQIRNEARLEFDKLINGDYFVEYGKKLLFKLDDELTEEIIPTNKYTFGNMITNKNYKDLTNEEKIDVDNKYKAYVESNKADKLDLAYNAFNTINEKFSDLVVNNFTGFYEKVKKGREDLLNNEKLFEGLDKDVKSTNIRTINEELNLPEIGMYELDKFGGQRKAELGLINDQVNNYMQTGTNIDSTIRGLFENKLNDIEESNYTDLVNNFTNTIDLLDDINDPIHNLIVDSGLNTLKFIKNPDIAEKTKIIEDNITPDVIDSIRQGLTKNRENLDDEYYNDIYNSGIYSLYDLDITKSDDVLKPEIAKLLAEQTQSEEFTYNIDLKLLRKNLDSITEKNPVFEFLNTIGLHSDVDTTTIMKLLENEDKKLKNTKTASDYVIEADQVNEELDQALHTLAIGGKLVNAAKTFETDGARYGYNQYVNVLMSKFDKTISPTKSLGIITHEEAHTVNLELSNLYIKLQYLKDLSEYNRSDKLREHKKTFFQVQLLQHEQLRKFFNNIGSKIEEDDKKILLEGLEINQTPEIVEATNFLNEWSTLVDTGNINEEQFKRFEQSKAIYENKAFDNFENLAHKYNNTNDLDAGRLTALKKIINTSGLVGDLTKENTSEMRSTTKELTEYDGWVKFITVLGLKASNWYELLNRSISTPEFEEFAPVYAQEYPARISTAMVLHPELFNILLDKIGSDNPKFYNTSFTNGYHGSGKSSATANIVYQILKSLGKTVTVSSIVDSQVENLKTNLKISEGFNKSIIFSKILPGHSIKEFIKNGKFDKNAALKFIDTLENSTSTKKIDIGEVIMIDEVTHYNAAELEYIANFAKQTNRTLVTFGDTLQQGAFYEGSEYNLSQGYKIQSPTLEFSMRANNMWVRDNNNMIRSMAFEMEKMDYNDVDIDERSRKLNGQIKNIIFNYHETENLFNGTKTVTKINIDDVNKLIKIAGDAKKFGIIYDNVNSELFKIGMQLKQAGKDIEMHSLHDVQGLELDYFAIDVDLNKGTTKPDMLKFTKILNTIVSRARNGSILVDSNKLFSSIDKGYTYSTKIDKDLLIDFATKRKASLSELLAKYPSDIKMITPTKTSAGIIGTSGGAIDLKTNLINDLFNDKEFSNESDNTNATKIAKEVPEGRVTASSALDILGCDIEKDKITKTDIIKNYEEQSWKNKTTNTNVKLTRDIGLFVEKTNDDITVKELIPLRKKLNIFRRDLLEKGSFKDVNNISNLFDNDLLKSYDWENGKFKIIYKKWDNSDKPHELGNENYGLGDRKDIFSRTLVYEAKNLDTGNLAQIHLLDIHKPMNPINDLKSQDLVILQNGEYHERDIDIRNVKKSSSNNQFVINKDSKIQFHTLFDLENNDGRHMIISDPYIGTKTELISSSVSDDYEPIEKTYFEGNKLNDFFLSKNHRGRPFVFVTQETDLRFPDGEQVPATKLYEYYKSHMEERFRITGGSDRPLTVDELNNMEYQPVVRRVRLSSKGRPYLKFMEDYTNLIEHIKSNDLKAIEEAAAPALTARMLKGLYERITKLRNMKETIKLNSTLEGYLQNLELVAGVLNVNVKIEPKWEETTDKINKYKLLGVTVKKGDIIYSFDKNTVKNKTQLAGFAKFLESGDLTMEESELKKLRGFLNKEEGDKVSPYYQIITTLAQLSVERPGVTFKGYGGYDENIAKSLKWALTEDTKEWKSAFPQDIFMMPVFAASNGSNDEYVKPMFLSDMSKQNFGFKDYKIIGQYFTIDLNGETVKQENIQKLTTNETLKNNLIDQIVKKTNGSIQPDTTKIITGATEEETGKNIISTLPKSSIKDNVISTDFKYQNGQIIATTIDLNAYGKVKNYEIKDNIIKYETEKGKFEYNLSNNKNSSVVENKGKITLENEQNLLNLHNAYKEKLDALLKNHPQHEQLINSILPIDIFKDSSEEVFKSYINILSTLKSDDVFKNEFMKVYDEARKILCP